jgi:glucose/arabinose dehydrogenase
MQIILNTSIILSIFSITNLNAQFTLEEAFPNISLAEPVDLQNSGDGSDRIFIVEQAGRIKVFPNSLTVQSTKTFLDITDRVSSGGERGLLGLAFHPNYENNGYFYVNYTVPNPLRTRISRFTVSSTDPDSANKSSELILLTFNQPAGNHNGGWIGFGPNDGYLYIGVGDGGSGGDPQNHGQNINTILGNILRIDVNNQDMGLQYAIPSDNPFVDSTGSVVKEIYAYGMRNPWRSSFDPVTGWLWCADVGQNCNEEISIIEKGANYGWRIMEAFHCFNRQQFNDCTFTGCDTSGLKVPIWEYGRSLGYSITGGYVYRGPNVPELTGKYIFADWGSNRIWALEYDGINPATNELLLFAPGSPTSFGVDESNELYIVTTSSSDKIYRFTPTVSDIDDLSIYHEYTLNQNYPNPFNPATSIRFSIADFGFVTLKVYDVLGNELATLVNEQKPAGNYRVTFDALSAAGGLPSGIYFYTLKTGNYSSTKKMILLR